MKHHMACKGFRGFKALLMALVLLISLLGGSAVAASPDAPVIGIAWRSDLDSEFYTNVCIAIEQAGGQPVLLDQVIAEQLQYDGANELVGCIDEVGGLTLEAAEVVKNGWQASNAEEVIGEIDVVVFTGGADISSSLYRTPEPWHGIEAEIDYDAERDVSDYILMQYCLDNNIAVMGFCRGMQMLAVVGGASMIQDIPVYFDSLNLKYAFEHRNEKATPDSYRDYVPHEVDIAEDSLAMAIIEKDVLNGCPSWHHQAVLSTEGTDLVVTGTTTVNGETMIEILEYTQADFAVGLQFHPEAAMVKTLNGVENAADFMEYETAKLFFKALVAQAAD